MIGAIGDLLLVLAVGHWGLGGPLAVAVPRAVPARGRAGAVHHAAHHDGPVARERAHRRIARRQPLLDPAVFAVRTPAGRADRAGAVLVPAGGQLPAARAVPAAGPGPGGAGVRRRVRRPRRRRTCSTSLRAPALTVRFGTAGDRHRRRAAAPSATCCWCSPSGTGELGGPLAALFPGLFLLGAGQGLCITPLTTTVLSHADARTAGSITGALSTAQQVGNAIGVAVSGVIFFGLLEPRVRGGLRAEHGPDGRPAARRGGAHAALLRPAAATGKADTEIMATMLTIGEFSRMTHLSVKALRHYHDVGVLEPAAIDPFTGYRSYDASQVASAQVIRRLRDLGMSLDSIRTVVASSDLETRNREIAAHLDADGTPARADAGLGGGAAGAARGPGRAARDRAADASPR